MLCDICKQNRATLHIKNNINGVIIEKDICGGCYDKMLGNDYTSALERVIKSLSEAAGYTSVPEIKCSVCSTKLSCVLDTLFVGCPNCYRELSEYILSSIKNVQNATVHEGKRPLGAKESITDEYERLRNELNKAINTENYEQAAIISARLKQLRGENNE